MSGESEGQPQGHNPWVSRAVTDLIFEAQGHGWYPAEFHDSLGFRWTGPGHISSTEVYIPPNSIGLIEIHIVAVGSPPISDNVEFFLNGARLKGSFRQEGRVVVYSAPVTPTMIGYRQSSILWIMVSRLKQEITSAARLLGVALSIIVVEIHGTAPQESRQPAIDDFLGRLLRRRALDVVVNSTRNTSLAEEGGMHILRVAAENVAIGAWVEIGKVQWELRCSATDAELVIKVARVAHPSASDGSLGLPLAGVSSEIRIGSDKDGLPQKALWSALIIAAPNLIQDALVNSSNPSWEVHSTLLRVSSKLYELRQSAEAFFCGLCHVDSNEMWAFLVSPRNPISYQATTVTNFANRNETNDRLASHILRHHENEEGYSHIQVTVFDWRGLETNWERFDFKIQQFSKICWIEIRPVDCQPPPFYLIDSNFVDSFGSYIRCPLKDLYGHTLRSENFHGVPQSVWRDIAEMLHWICGRDLVFSAEGGDDNSWIAKCWENLKSRCSKQTKKMIDRDENDQSSS